MKDIDFDELDKAVSSLMKGVPQSELETKRKEEDVKEIPSSSPSTVEAAKWQPQPTSSTQQSQHDTMTVESLPSQDTGLDRSSSTASEPALEPKQDSDKSNKQQSIVPQRTSGRFMDIVPQKSGSKDQPAYARRRSQIISPANDTSSDELAKEQVTLPSSKNTSAWPDPLELQENTRSSSQVVDEPVSVNAVQMAEAASNSVEHNEETETKQREEFLTTPKQTDISASTEVVSPQKPASSDYSSPFLTDAKVEKRPLGGASDENADPAPVEDSSSSHNDGDSDAVYKKETTSATAQPQEPLPEELRTDILAIESGNSASHTGQEIAGSDSSEAAEKTITKESATNDSPISSGPQVTSIAQQYKIKQTESPAEHAPIYDSHPEPLSHPAKSKSGWLTVLWILGLVLLGAGGAAALYFLNIV